MQPATYRQSLWHAEFTVPMVVGFAALVVLYLWVRPFLNVVMFVSIVGLALASGGSQWAKRSERDLADLDHAQPESVRPDRLRRFRSAHVALTGLTNSLVVILLVALLLKVMPGL